MGVEAGVCPQCGHLLAKHFYEKNYPELSFCMVDEACPCDYFEEVK